MSNTPAVSVIIPTYNRAHLIGRAIKSVLSQTYKDFELIVVDDASVDNPEQVVRSFNGKRIKYIRHKKNRGLPASRNTAIKAAEGEYIALLDDDDEWLPEKLEKQVNKFQSVKDSVGVISCGHKVISDVSGRIIRTRIPTHKGNVHHYVLRGVFVGSGSVALIKKDCFKKAGFYDESLTTAEDWDMAARISKHFEYDFVPEVLVITHFHGERMSSVPENKIKAREIIIKKHHDEFSKYPLVFADHLNRLGILHSLAGNFNQGGKYFLESIKRRPIQRFAYFYFLALFLPLKMRRNILNKNVVKIDGIPIYW